MCVSSAFKCYILLTVAHCCFGLFEDQVGKFDWRQQYVGEANFVEFDSNGNGRRILVATEDNVVAAISSRSGALEWRQVLEKGPAAHVDDACTAENSMIAVQGGGTYVRSFSSLSGDLIWENNIPSPDPTRRGRVAVFGSDNVAVVAAGQITVYDVHSGSEQWSKPLPQSAAWYVSGTEAGVVVVSVAHQQLSVAAYDETGAAVASATATLNAPWLNARTSCVVVASAFVCVEGGVIYSLDLSKPTTFNMKTLESLGLSSNVPSVESISTRSVADSMQDTVGGAIVGLRLGVSSMAALRVSDGGMLDVLKSFPADVPSLELTTFHDKTVLLATELNTNTETLTVRAYDITTGTEVPELRQAALYSARHHGAGAGAVLGSASHLYRRKDGQLATRTLIRGRDHSLTLVTGGGRVAWRREEALAHILAVEMVDLPVAPSLANMEEEFGGTVSPDNLVEMFVKRISTQLTQLKDALLWLRQRLRLPRPAHHHHGDEDDIVMEDDLADDERDLTRDEFNLHKMIVVTTAAGKIFGMETYSGSVVWRHLVPGLAPFPGGDKPSLPVFVLRSTAHFPLTPYCSVVGRDQVTGEGIVYSFDPITGAPVTEDMWKVESLRAQQVYQLAHMDENFIRPLVILTTDNKYVVVPSSDQKFVEELSSSLYMFTSDTQKATLQGYAMRPHNNELVAEKLWNVNLHHDGHVITNVVVKRAAEHVHSQGVVLGDRSVLYKYINPNLVAVSTEGGSGDGEAVALYLIDAVTGHVVFHSQQRKARGPVQLVHSENWIVLTYWNVKKWRVEVAVLELYEGAQQSNSTAFSSLSPPPPPVVMRQAFIFPAHVAAMAATLTERGLTNKQIIIALQSGGVLGMPKMLLDARRPVVLTAEHREEGLIPYMPELARPPDAMINYNQTLYNVAGIHTAAAGLESTSLVFCYGLDLFFTRVTPSKLFDVLNDDFDYLFIGSVTAGMIVVSIISRKLAARKALNRAWK